MSADWTCAECKKLHDEAASAIKQHIDATSSLSSEVRSEVEPDLDVLKRSISDCSFSRMDAVQRYENHIASHQTKVLTAGG